MKIKILTLILSLFSFNNVVHADLGSDLKTLGLSSLYGSIGGTLVGVAAMAVGGKSSSIAKGASIGLVAGAGIGGYFVVKERMSEKNLQETGEPSKIYDNARLNDYNDIYYGKRWEMVGNWDNNPVEYNFEHQLNKIPTKNNLMIFFNLFQKNF